MGVVFLVLFLALFLRGGARWISFVVFCATPPHIPCPNNNGGGLFLGRQNMRDKSHDRQCHVPKKRGRSFLLD